MAKPNIFNSVQVQKPKKNVFDLTHDVKMSTKMGQLTPVLVQECIPGDMFNIGADSLIRFAPLTAPVMHRMDVSIHYFFVPNRLTWSNWESFITGGEDGSAAPAFPTLSYSEANKAKYDVGSLSDYMGIPSPATAGHTQTLNANALPFRAYQLIYTVVS